MSLDEMSREMPQNKNNVSEMIGSHAPFNERMRTRALNFTLPGIHWIHPAKSLVWADVL